MSVTYQPSPYHVTVTAEEQYSGGRIVTLVLTDDRAPLDTTRIVLADGIGVVGMAQQVADTLASVGVVAQQVPA